jgi:hypothetical protein
MLNGLNVLFALQKRASWRGKLVVWAMRVGAVLVPEVVLEIDEVAAHMRDSRSSNDAKLHPALVAVFILDGIELVFERSYALGQALTVCTCII